MSNPLYCFALLNEDLERAIYEDSAKEIVKELIKLKPNEVLCLRWTEATTEEGNLDGSIRKLQWLKVVTAQADVLIVPADTTLHTTTP